MTTTPTHATERKTVLFCRACGYENPVDGDWRVTERTATGARERVYECPDCRTTVQTRPLFERPPARP